MMKDKNFIIISGLVLVILFSTLSTSVKAETLCSYAGPDLSEDLLRLTNFSVTGPSPLKEGDTVTVKFNLQNFGQYDFNLGTRGIFAAALYPDNIDTSFGFSYAQTTFKVGKTLSVEVSRVLDKPGTWVIWPSYHLSLAMGEKLGPDNWHACSLSVGAKVKDSDQDGISDEQDNCPLKYNPDQKDSDQDGVGDVCDNCLDVYNPDQKDSDNDRIGDACEVKDSDQDGILDEKDNCPQKYNPDQIDKDNDSLGDVCDNCPDVANQDQKDSNQNGIGDACEKKRDENPSTIKITQIPHKPKLGDRIKYKVTVFDLDGVELIELWLDGEQEKTCFAELCEYTSSPITEEPQLGVRIIDGVGNVATDGFMPEEARVVQDWWFEDDDNDDIENIFDNCRDSPNSDQEDSDNDGVGDVCDECNLYVLCSETSGSFWNYCYASPGESRELLEYEREGEHYFDFYDLVPDNGCGCMDSDRGLNYFESGSVLEETVGRDDLYDPSRGYRCRAWSDCEISGYDRCRGNTLTEYYCDSSGPGTYTIECPAGCSGGACICPDTDGGKDYYNQGTIEGQTDECLDSTRLREWSCGEIRGGNVIPKEEIINCPYGCENGACVCQDSDNGLNYDVMGRIGTYQDYCINNRELIEYYSEARNNYCYIDSRSYRCEGLCQDGACLPPTCNDRIRNQGEEDIDCGGPCTECGYAAIKGKILYEEADANGNSLNDFKPARSLKFKIKGDISTGTKLTDSNGYFNILIPREGNVGEEIYIQIGDCGMYNSGFNYAVKIARDLDYCNEYVGFRGNRREIPETGDLDFGDLRIGINDNLDFRLFKRQRGMRAGSNPCRKGFCPREFDWMNGGSGYFNIAETILVAREYADSKRDDSDPIGKVTVEWPDSEWSNYQPYWELIKLRPEHGFSDGTIIHEYGHHLEKKISQHDRYVCTPYPECTEHDFCSDKDDTEFAWSEGFAEYFGTIVPHHHRQPNPRFLSDPNIAERDAETLPCTDDSGNFKSGKDIEGTVVNVLWDLVDDFPNPTFPDSIDEIFDTISGKEDLIFSIFDRELDNRVDAPDLCELIREGWDCRDEVRAERDAIDPILEHYNVNCQRGCGK